MRFAGRITDWNDEKGFGFVAPNGGGGRAFVHVSAFKRGARRPVAGDLVSYRVDKDNLGRLQARHVTYASEPSPSRARNPRFPRAAIGIGALAVISGLAAMSFIPSELALLYIALSTLCYLMYWLDKRAAGKNAQRTPESRLHLFDLLGGWPGALIAQQQFRHKTIKQPFQVVFWATVVVNIAVVGWLVWSGEASGLLRMLGR